jgi:class 3 adenylate cyclase
VGPAYLVVSVTVLSAALVAAGPRITILAATYVPVSILMFYLLQRFWAVVCNAFAVGQFGTLTWLNEWPAPVVQLVVMLTIVVATGVVVSGIAERSDVLAASEHRARLETAEMNRTLEERVASQVTEIERLGQLRRFLSPQVADAVMSGGSESLAQPHRQRIAVCFCDLRGFTAFTRAAEPEEVLAVLDEYYRAVGEVLQKHDATIGGYAGDGIMAYFGDPVPLDDPALAAVTTAAELRGPLDDLVERWKLQRYELGYGIGLSYGYATLGVVGFDGRYDYTPLGPVVNLAARLCARAEHAQILLDHSTHLATVEQIASEHHAELDLKGYAGTTSTYTLT